MRAAIRYLIALIVLTYGFAKINGAQFTILDSELDKPLGKVNGFWLTWYYFGFSAFYGMFIALGQIAGALLLTFRRTVLLGGCILAPMLLNILLIDICYGVEPGATIMAALLLVGTLWTVGDRWRTLAAILWPSGEYAGKLNWRTWGGWIGRLSMLIFAFGVTYWVANVNNRAPTPLDGAWDVIHCEPQSQIDRIPRTIFFEHNRAHLLVFKTANGSYHWHHFEVDREKKTIQFWDRWMGKGKKFFEGTYVLADSDLSLQGLMLDAGDIQLQLRQRAVR